MKRIERVRIIGIGQICVSRNIVSADPVLWWNLPVSIADPLAEWRIFLKAYSVVCRLVPFTFLQNS